MALDDVFKALADGQRRRILGALNHGPRRAGELGRLVGLSPNALSFHLRLLRQAGLVTRRREGKSLVYTSSRPAIQAWLHHVRQMWPEAWAVISAGGQGGQLGGQGRAGEARPLSGEHATPDVGPSTTEALATELL